MTVPSTSRGSRVRLGISSLIGEHVATLVDEALEAGTHTVTWDAEGMPSGAYFVTLTVDDVVKSFRLELVR